MAVDRVSVDLDAELLDRARAVARTGHASATQVVEDALAIYLGLRALDEVHAQGGLGEEEADRVAVEEVRAYRRSRDNAA